jgi:hypothetical protein
VLFQSTKLSYRFLVSNITALLYRILALLVLSRGTASVLHSFVGVVATSIATVTDTRSRIAVFISSKGFLSSCLSRRDCGMTIATGHIFVA